MNAEKRMAGLFGSAAFIIVGLGGYLHTLNALQSILYGIAASFVLGFIGYRMGYIVSHPKGKKKKNQPVAKPGNAVEVAPGVVPMTGEESFLDDVGNSAS